MQLEQIGRLGLAPTELQPENLLHFPFLGPVLVPPVPRAGVPPVRVHSHSVHGVAGADNFSHRSQSESPPLLLFMFLT